MQIYLYQIYLLEFQWQILDKRNIYVCMYSATNKLHKRKYEYVCMYASMYTFVCMQDVQNEASCNRNSLSTWVYAQPKYPTHNDINIITNCTSNDKFFNYLICSIFKMFIGRANDINHCCFSI